MKTPRIRFNSGFLRVNIVENSGMEKLSNKMEALLLYNVISESAFKVYVYSRF